LEAQSLQNRGILIDAKVVVPIDKVVADRLAINQDHGEQNQTNKKKFAHPGQICMVGSEVRRSAHLCCPIITRPRESHKPFS
jgi:hypothetical protein